MLNLLQQNSWILCHDCEVLLSLGRGGEWIEKSIYEQCVWFSMYVSFLKLVWDSDAGQWQTPLPKTSAVFLELWIGVLRALVNEPPQSSIKNSEIEVKALGQDQISRLQSLSSE
jgi:hypothetical protein